MISQHVHMIMLYCDEVGPIHLFLGLILPVMLVIQVVERVNSSELTYLCTVNYLAYDIYSEISKVNIDWYFYHSISERLELFYESVCLLIDWTQQCL